MSAVFADTSFFLAVLNPRDAAHGAFVEWMRSARHEIVTTEFVLLELGNALSARTLRALFAALIDELRSDPASSVVPLSSAALADGVQLFRTRADKEWSLTDCTSFVIMPRLGLTDVLTTDHHFRQAGFNVLPATD